MDKSSIDLLYMKKGASIPTDHYNKPVVSSERRKTMKSSALIFRPMVNVWAYMPNSNLIEIHAWKCNSGKKPKGKSFSLQKNFRMPPEIESEFIDTFSDEEDVYLFHNIDAFKTVFSEMTGCSFLNGQINIEIDRALIVGIYLSFNRNCLEQLVKAGLIHTAFFFERLSSINYVGNNCSDILQIPLSLARILENTTPSYMYSEKDLNIVKRIYEKHHSIMSGISAAQLDYLICKEMAGDETVNMTSFRRLSGVRIVNVGHDYFEIDYYVQEISKALHCNIVKVPPVEERKLFMEKCMCTLSGLSLSRLLNFKLKERNMNHQKYEFSSGPFFLMLPTSYEQCVVESFHLNNCLVSFARKVIQEEPTLVLLFLRRREAPSTPLIDVLIDTSSGEITQYYGVNNEIPQRDVLEFLDFFASFHGFVRLQEEYAWPNAPEDVGILDADDIYPFY